MGLWSRTRGVFKFLRITLLWQKEFFIMLVCLISQWWRARQVKTSRFRSVGDYSLPLLIFLCVTLLPGCLIHFSANREGASVGIRWAEVKDYIQQRKVEREEQEILSHEQEVLESIQK